ncbi:regulator [Streptomyces sp. NPDC088789]|uniref:regulator n=1 Tax=Streptomyces sp. NPDC088789 TaxID=3365899 RepID=UPI003812466E
MTTTAAGTPAPGETARIIETLAHPALIRLVTEIDDHGPVPHALAPAFPDLPPRELRHVRDTARALGLIDTGHHAGQPAYLLTGRGTALADLYEATARWARAHDQPTRHCQFTTRVQTVFHHFAHSLRDDDTALPAPADLLDTLLQWISTSPDPSEALECEAA